MDALVPGDPGAVGPYRLLGRLGSGGMGRVFLGRSTDGRTVAVKVVHAELALDPEFRQRFRREVQAARQVVGEWTAPVVAADTEAAVPWAATAYIPALSLQEAVQRYGCLPEESVWALAFGLARALETIHNTGLVHRDLKPSNVLLGLGGPRVIDFGIARAVDGDGLTRTGILVGTAGYISPEQVNGEPVTGASDVFCLGSVLVFAATGHSPFPNTDGGSAARLLAVVSQPPTLDGLSAPLREVAEACLAQEPSQRPAPDRIAELAEAAGYDRNRPWLPADLLDHLGREAVSLLQPPHSTALDSLQHDGLTQTAVPRPASTAIPAPPPPAQSPAPALPNSTAPERRLIWPLLLAASALVVGVGIAAWNLRDTDNQADGAPPSAVASSTPASSSSASAASANPKPTTSDTSASPKPTQPASPYRGTWRGVVTAGDYSFPVIVVYKGGKIGETVATVKYTSVPCSGHWVLISETSHRLVVQELIDRDESGGCEDAKTTLTRTKGGTLHYVADEVQGTLKRD